MEKINATLGGIPSLSVSLGETPTVTVSAQTVTVKPLVGDVEKYDGSYDVEPLPEAQSLPTAKRYCTDDIYVRAIPFYEVSNTSGGTTVIIDKLN